MLRPWLAAGGAGMAGHLREVLGRGLGFRSGSLSKQSAQTCTEEGGVGRRRLPAGMSRTPFRLPTPAPTT